MLMFLKTCTALQNVPMQTLFDKPGYARDPHWQQCQKDLSDMPGFAPLSCGRLVPGRGLPGIWGRPANRERIVIAPCRIGPAS
jgi:hypothetical protein